MDIFYEYSSLSVCDPDATYPPPVIETTVVPTEPVTEEQIDPITTTTTTTTTLSMEGFYMKRGWGGYSSAFQNGKKVFY